MHLDLENPAPFLSIIRDDSEGCADVLKLCRSNNHLVTTISACGDLPDALTRALSHFIRAAKERVQSVAAYHGCRVFDESSYRRHGIRRPKAEELINWCKEFFGHEAQIDKIVGELGRAYINHGESAVFCMRGIEAARKNNCCHQDGSEFVRNIARRLGPTSEEKYYAAGRSCFIEVRTPIEWFERHSQGSVDSLLRDVFVHWLWVELSLDWPGDPRVGGIEFGTDIPAEYVKAFHYV